MLFSNCEVVMTTEDRWIEGGNISLKLFRCLKAKEKGISLVRKVRFDKEAGDLCIKVEGKRYFYSEFK